MQVFVVNRDACTGCEECLGICPVGALVMLRGRAHIDMGRCLCCGACLRECGEDAISWQSTRTENATRS